MKFCKDCAHFTEVRRCRGPQNTYVDLITGETLYRDDWRANPGLNREDGVVMSRILGTCGRRARFFKPKAPLNP